jgi:hypothetical protein
VIRHTQESDYKLINDMNSRGRSFKIFFLMAAFWLIFFTANAATYYSRRAVTGIQIQHGQLEATPEGRQLHFLQQEISFILQTTLSLSPPMPFALHYELVQDTLRDILT